MVSLIHRTIKRILPTTHFQTASVDPLSLAQLDPIDGGVDSGDP